jgi:hypothetical protein
MQTIGTFNGTEIDYRFEYTEARKFMGQKDTDMDQLLSTVAHLYLQCPEDMQVSFQALLLEIQKRIEYLDLLDSLSVTVGGAA